MLLFGNEVVEYVAEDIGIDGRRGDMDRRDQSAVGADAQDILERRFGVDEEGFDGIELVEFIAGDDAFGGDQERQDARLAIEREVADDADQDERDRHERAVGIEGVRDDSDEKRRDDHPRTGPELKRLMLRRLPMEQYLTIGGRKGICLFACLWGKIRCHSENDSLRSL